MQTTVVEDQPDTYIPVHPDQGDDPASTVDRWGVEGMMARARTDAYTTACVLRRQIAPHAITGTVLGAGLAAEAVATAGGASPAALSMGIAAAAFPAAAVIAGRVRRRGSVWGRRALFGGLTGAAWLSIAPFGIGAEHVTTLVACEYALAARWWQLNRIGNEPAYEETEPAYEEQAAAPLTPVEQIIADWEEFIACQGGPLQNSQLICPEQTQHGFSFTLTLWRGRQTFATAIAVLDRLASGLACGVDQIIVEPFPQEESHPLLKSAARCRFQVITSSPISGDVVFDGPRRRGGILELGPYADGHGEAPYRLYTPGSMWSGLIIGGTGIGKSRVVENIVISALSGGDTEYWYLDPGRGGSSPALAKHADWFANTEEAQVMLDAAIAVLEARTDENAVEGITGFTPSPERPGLLLVVEECHNVFNSDNAKQWARIAREGRKVGIALICVSQKSSVDTFGGDDVIRSSTLEGNALVLRSTSNQTGQMIAGLQIDPKTLPKIAGYAYVQGSEESGVRTAPFRNRNTEPDGGPGAARWLAAQPRPGLDTLSATATLAAGTAYRDRGKSTSTGRAGSRARVEALRSGHLPEGVLRGDADTATTEVELAQVIEFPTFIKPTLIPALNLPPVTGLSPSHQAVLDAVAAGLDRPSDIETHIGLGHRRVAALLRDLVEAGHLVKPRHGRYQRAA